MIHSGEDSRAVTQRSPIPQGEIQSEPSAHRFSLFVGIPAYGGVDASCVSALTNLRMELHRRDIPSALGLVSHNSLIYDARNRLLEAFLSTGFSHLLLVDSDIEFQASTVFQLIAIKKEFVAAAVPLRGIQWDVVNQLLEAGVRPTATNSVQYNIGIADPARVLVDPTGLIQVPFVGTAFMLIQRCAIERMVQHYSELIYESGGKEIPGLFLPILTERQLLGEDVSFCKRWTDIGGEIWLYPNATLSHTGPTRFDGNLGDALGRVWQQQRRGPMDMREK